ncbi:MAG: S8 family serine peptidase [Bacteroidota bacterium]
MQWRISGYIILFAVNVLFGQTYIVKFKQATRDSANTFLLVQQSLNNIKTIVAQPNTFTIQPLSPSIPSNKSSFPWQQYSIIRFSQQPSDDVIRSISSNPSVEFINPSNQYRTYTVPNDSAYHSQWNLRQIGIASLWESGLINASLPSVTVGVIDTGIDDDHPDLTNTIALNTGEMGNGKENNRIDDDGNGFIDDWRGYDFVDGESEDVGDWNERDNDPTDENGHGTAVSGIIGAQSNNIIGLTGIFPVKILPMRAFGKNGNGSDIDIAIAVVYAVDNGADVINMSFGDVVSSTLLHDAIRYAYSKNVILVASSGNDGSSNPHYPSDFSEVISTGSVNPFNVRSFFSSNSPSLDIMAPGEQIVTTVLGGGYTGQFSGTSAAAPHISGISALMKSFEKKKKVTNASYVELSNEEIRGILLNTADDAGENGWDASYASGIVNIVKAIQAISGSTVSIHSPMLDDIITQNSIPLVITAFTPYLQSVQMFFGEGNNPSQWTLIKSIPNKIFIRDTFSILDVSFFKTNDYQLRLVVKNSKGNDLEFRQRIVINQNNPKVLSFRFRDSVIIGNEFGALIEAEIDRKCTGMIYYRKVGENQYQTKKSIGVQLHHSFVLSSNDLDPSIQYEFFCLFTENSIEKRVIRFPLSSIVGFDHFQTKISPLSIATTGFDKKSYSLPKGFLLNQVQNLGIPNIVLNTYNENNDFGTVKLFQFKGNQFEVRDSSVRSWVPRSFITNPVENYTALLVQDRGTSSLQSIDLNLGKYFEKSPLWTDSTDIWASQMVDLDGDNQQEIIARSSSEFLIYKNLGNKKFSLVSRLSNPSNALFGEARNQFGPPRSIVGDFTNSGRKEIVFADNDGDVVMYRQTVANSLNFEIGGIDSSDLYEMSDYITSGDFNGDGILDFAVAGHSSLDWNEDREYSAPVWTIRVFSHLPTDIVGKVSKIWEQHFFGVKSGTGYDNGLVGGKLRKSDSKDALFISLNPQLYIFVWNEVKKTFESKWMHSSQSNSVIVYDFDGDSTNDLGFHTNGKTEFWSEQNITAVQSPFGLTALPLSVSKIKLRWSSFATNHKIFRGLNKDTLNLVSLVAGTEWIDSTVSTNNQYFYAVSAVNGGESSRSNIVSVTPHIAPKILSVSQASRFQLSIELSSDVTSENILSSIFLIDSILESSSVVWKSSRILLATFPTTITAGNHVLNIRQLTDASGMSGDTVQHFLFTSTLQNDDLFFVRSSNLLSKNKIQIEFNGQPDFTIAKNSSYYSVHTIARQFFVSSVDSIQPQSVVLNFSTGTNLSELALRIEIVIGEQITSVLGKQLNGGKGQVVSIAQETESINNIAVYPNPVKNNQRISFANIPANCKITIYTPDGERIKTIEEKTTTEGASWNLRNESGNLVSTGIYLYRVEQFNAANEVHNTTIGKFAVIR